MRFAPFGFENQVVSSVIPINTSGLTLYVDAQLSSSNPGSGTVWNDISGNNYNPTLYPTNTYTAGPPASFNQTGTTSTLTTNVMLFPAASAQSNTSSYSFGGWINLTVTSVAQRFIYMRGDDAGTPGSSGWSLSIRQTRQSTNQYILDLGVTSSGNATTYTSSSDSFQINRWYYVYGTFDIPTRAMKIYTLGQGTFTSTQATFASTITSLRVAGTAGWSLARLNANGATHTMFNGTQFGSFEVYNRVLSAGEIQNNFNATRTKYGV
jgi:hypothetical protein